MLIQTSKLISLPLLQLVDKDQKYNLDEISKVCVGIGTTEKIFKDTEFKII